MNKYIYNDPITKLDRRRRRKNATDAEQKLWSILRKRQVAGLKFFRQYSVGQYILDFYSPERRLAVEVDGGQHADIYGQQHDSHRDNYLTELNIRVIGFWNPDKSGQNIEAVGKRIREEAEKHS